MIQIRVLGGQRVVRKLDTLSNLSKSELRLLGGKMLDSLLENMPDYPPQRRGSRYVRTYNLWQAVRSKAGEHPMSLSTFKMLGSNVVVTLGLKPYGPYVVGMASQQAWMHKGRWWTLASVVRNNMTTLRKAAKEFASEIISRAGFGI